jgi:hypothetical protein
MNLWPINFDASNSTILKTPLCLSPSPTDTFFYHRQRRRKIPGINAETNGPQGPFLPSFSICTAKHAVFPLLEKLNSITSLFRLVKKDLRRMILTPSLCRPIRKVSAVT